MDRTESLLWVQRAHEAIRSLPEDADVYGFDLSYDYESGARVNCISIHLSHPVNISPAIPGKEYSGWREMRVPVTPFATAWWAQYKEAEDE